MGAAEDTKKIAARKRTPKLTWAAVTRQPTGTHFLDSGGANGRHWQQPLPTSKVRLEAVYGGKEVLAYIPLHVFLEAHFEIDHKSTRWLRAASERTGRYGYEEYASLLAEKLGLAHLSGDYTYNGENDLTQDFQFTVVGPEGKDWCWGGDEVLFIIETHNGADARGGFSDPVVCRLKSDCFPYTVAGFRIAEGRDADGRELTYDECQALDEEWQIGYASYPTGRLADDIAEIISVKEEKNEATIRLKSGETVRVYAYAESDDGGLS